MTTRKSSLATPKSASTRTPKSTPPARKSAKARAPKATAKAGAPKAATKAGAPKAAAAKAKPRGTSRGQEAEPAIWTLRLYITGRGERSERALRNLRNLCEANMKEGTYKIEVIDLLKNPALAKADQILAIPTLVRKLPEPMKRIIGDLSDADRALLSLDLPKLQ